MSDSRRKNIKKALHGDLQTKEACDCGGIEIFYGLLKNTYGRIKMPCPSLDFFMNAFRFLQGKGRVNFFLTSYKGKNIAGRAVLVYKGVIYDWYAGSSKEALSYYANELIIWQIILWGKKKGYKVFDFGGAGSPATYYGPAEFKRRFGGREVNFGRFEKAYNKKIHWLIKKYSRLSLKKL
jgi:lipid II:glycine glycyltransferase (peptidoglycan interpeptide bridge formation enzyme)